MGRSSFLGKYLAGLLVLGVLLAGVLAAESADHAKPGEPATDDDIEALLRRSSSSAGAKDNGKNVDPAAPNQVGQDDESYRRFLINALMGLKQQQWGWVGATSGPQPQQPVYTVSPPAPQDLDHVPSSPQAQPPTPQQPSPVAPPPPPPPPPQSQSPQQQMPPMCPQYSVMPQATPPPMQSFAEKIHPQFGQCVTVLLPSPAAMPGYNTVVPQSVPADANVIPQQPIPGCRNGCNGRGHAPRRPTYY